MRTHYNFLFNFSASYSGGGYKRLYEYARWFDAAGGATFVLHPNCSGLQGEFPNNQYHVAAQSRWRRLVDDCGYLRPLTEQLGQPDLYYAYGVPVYFPVGRVNWFHLSNVLPLTRRGIPLSLYDRLRLASLGRRIRSTLRNAEVISAESLYSLGLFDMPADRLFVSVNGSDDELGYLQQQGSRPKADTAVVVGTYGHKALAESLQMFEMLAEQRPGLRLVVVGDPGAVPAHWRELPNVTIRGMLRRPQVIETLQAAKVYISTTLIENSYNAASEGALIADESFISDIGPHRELLTGCPFEELRIRGSGRPMLHVRRQDLRPANLKTWNSVVLEMIARFEQVRVR